MIRNYFKTAFRNLLHNKVYSFINIAGLTLGLACTMLIVLYVKDETSYDRFHTNRDHVYRVVRKLVTASGGYFASDGYTGLPQGPQFTAGIPELSGFVRLQNGQKDLQQQTTVRTQQVLYADSNFFSVFSFPLLQGNPVTSLLQAHSIVISADLARQQFGNTDALNKIIMLKGDSTFEPCLVTGVAKNCPQNSIIKFDAILPLQASKKDEYNSDAWLNVYLHTFVVLRSTADARMVEAGMKEVYEANAAASFQRAKEKYDIQWSPVFLLQPITDIHLSKDYPAMDGLSDASNPLFSYLLLSIAFFILLIACINFVNLTIARSIRRAKEIGIRKVAGSNHAECMGLVIKRICMAGTDLIAHCYTRRLLFHARMAGEL